ncbi:hypothetical protein NDU88_003398 [Pleurodeles waltl]|uniref:Uncharacterized protein n=1 Tax=Pleurodeles waltl TaxID=8319 RepID=A0AAV7W216_PLEWA|nr:hypothetical protein NDU88_003398 [Pleurodeles waltl]
MLDEDGDNWAQGLKQHKAIEGRRAEALWRTIARRRVAQDANAEEGHRSKEEVSVARLQEVGDSGKEEKRGQPQAQ